jgi:hypothetical protein
VTKCSGTVLHWSYTYGYTVNPTVSSNATIDTVNPTNTIVTSGASITVAYITEQLLASQGLCCMDLVIYQAQQRKTVITTTIIKSSDKGKLTGQTDTLQYDGQED